MARLYVFFSVFLWLTVSPWPGLAHISDYRLCADPQCSELISEAVTTLNYHTSDPELLSFPQNVRVLVYSKAAGKRLDLWGGEINGKRGYFLKKYVREQRVFKKDLEYNVTTLEAAEPQLDAPPPAAYQPHETDDGVHISEENSAEVVDDDVKPTEISPTSADYTVVDGTTLYNDESEPVPSPVVPTATVLAAATAAPNLAESGSAVETEAAAGTEKEYNTGTQPPTDDAAAGGWLNNLFSLVSENEGMDNASGVRDETEKPTTPPVYTINVLEVNDEEKVNTIEEVDSKSELDPTSDPVEAPGNAIETEKIENEIPVPETESSTTEDVIQNSKINVSSTDAETSLPEGIDQPTINQIDPLSESGDLHLFSAVASPALTESEDELVSVVQDVPEPTDDTILSDVAVSDINVETNSGTPIENPEMNGGEAGEEPVVARDVPLESSPIAAPYVSQPEEQLPDSTDPQTKEGESTNPESIVTSQDSDVTEAPVVDDLGSVNSSEETLSSIIDDATGSDSPYSGTVEVQDPVSADSNKNEQEQVDNSVTVQNGRDDSILEEEVNEAETEEPLITREGTDSVPTEPSAQDAVSITEDDDLEKELLDYIVDPAQSDFAEQGPSLVSETDDLPGPSNLVPNDSLSTTESDATDSPPAVWEEASHTDPVETDLPNTERPETISGGDTNEFMEQQGTSVSDSMSTLKWALRWIIQLMPSPLHGLLHDLEYDYGVSPRALILSILNGVFIVLVTFVYYLVKRMGVESTLATQLSSLDESVFKIKAEKDAALQKNDALSSELVDAQQLVEGLRVQLQDTKSETSRLQAQVASLEEQLEAATDAGIELNSMLSDVLNSQNDGGRLQAAVEALQQQLEQQRILIQEMEHVRTTARCENEGLQQQLDLSHLTIAELNAEIDKLREELSVGRSALASHEDELDHSNTHITQLQTANEQLLQEAKAWDDSVKDAECRLSMVEKSNAELCESLSFKDSEIETLKETIQQLKNLDSKQNDAGEIDTEFIDSLLDVVKVRAEMRTVLNERETVQQRLEEEQQRTAELKAQMIAIKEDLSQTMTEKDHATKAKNDAETRLSVLSGYFKEKELELQKELGVHEALRQQSQEATVSVTQRATLYEQEITNYKSQVELLKKELLEQEKSFRNQISTESKKSYENWLAARAAERKLKESQQEASILRNRLTTVEKEKQGSSLNEPLLTSTPTIDRTEVAPSPEAPVIAALSSPMNADAVPALPQDRPLPPSLLHYPGPFPLPPMGALPFPPPVMYDERGNPIPPPPMLPPPGMFPPLPLPPLDGSRGTPPPEYRPPVGAYRRRSPEGNSSDPSQHRDYWEPEWEPHSPRWDKQSFEGRRPVSRHTASPPPCSRREPRDTYSPPASHREFRPDSPDRYFQPLPPHAPPMYRHTPPDLPRREPDLPLNPQHRARFIDQRTSLPHANSNGLDSQHV